MKPDWEQFAGIVAARHCKRAFLARPVPSGMLERVLTVAANAPSTRNGQPWRAVVLTGAALDALVHRLCEEFDRGTPAVMDYPNRPRTVDPVAEERARQAGAGVLRALGIARDDSIGRRVHLRMNMQFYGAPAAMVFHLPADAVPGAFLELGFFVQNVMLGLVACGLGSCPQSSVAGYPGVLRDALGLPGRLIACTLAVGYPDPAVPVNSFAPARATLSEYVQWHDQAPLSATGTSSGSADVGVAATCSHSLDRTS